MIREINGVRYICLSPENEALIKEAAMNRKDLRSNESEWRGMSSAQRKPKPIKASKRSIKVVNIVYLVVAMIALIVLWESAPSKVFSACKGAEVHSNICKD